MIKTLGVCLLIALWPAPPALAGITLTDGQWHTTYDCPEWDRGMGTLPADCDGIGGGMGAWTCLGAQEQITAAANNPLGGGGRGQRHWVACGIAGTSIGSSGITIFFPDLQEFWMRFYTRFQPGVQCGSHDAAGVFQLFKMLYLQGAAKSNIGYFMLPSWASNDQVSYYSQSGDARHYPCRNCGFIDACGGRTSKGAWFCVEVHFRAEDAGRRNGVFQYWRNGELLIDRSGIEFGDTAFKGVLVGSNIKGGNCAGPCYYIDYDDIAISTKGYIGPLLSVTGEARRTDETSSGTPTHTGQPSGRPHQLLLDRPSMRE